MRYRVMSSRRRQILRRRRRRLVSSRRRNSFLDARYWATVGRPLCALRPHRRWRRTALFRRVYLIRHATWPTDNAGRRLSQDIRRLESSHTRRSAFLAACLLLSSKTSFRTMSDRTTQCHGTTLTLRVTATQFPHIPYLCQLFSRHDVGLRNVYPPA